MNSDGMPSSLGMPAEAPKPTRDEFFVVKFVVFGSSPRWLLEIGNNLKYEWAAEEGEGGVVADSEGRMSSRRDGIRLERHLDEQMQMRIVAEHTK
jgi:hypothetical protein